MKVQDKNIVTVQTQMYMSCACTCHENSGLEKKKEIKTLCLFYVEEIKTGNNFQLLKTFLIQKNKHCTICNALCDNIPGHFLKKKCQIKTVNIQSKNILLKSTGWVLMQ